MTDIDLHFFPSEEYATHSSKQDIAMDASEREGGRLCLSHCGWVQFGSVRVGVVVELGVLDNAGVGTSGGSAAAALQT